MAPKSAPAMIAGWNGLVEPFRWLLSLKPDLTRVNGYGGTLLGTILHGADHAPGAPGADHIECLRLVLTHGLALPVAELDHVGDPEVAAFLRDWAEDHPGQVVR